MKHTLYATLKISVPVLVTRKMSVEEFEAVEEDFLNMIGHAALNYILAHKSKNFQFDKEKARFCLE